jgi:hypothetical protein
MSDELEVEDVGNESANEPVFDPWPPRAEIVGAALLAAAVLLILAGVVQALATSTASTVSNVAAWRQRVQLVARSAGIFPGFLVIGAIVMADLEHVVSARPPSRSDLARWVLRMSGAVAVVIAMAGAVGVLNALIGGADVFGQRSIGFRFADAFLNLAGGLLGAAAAWAVASAAADDVTVNDVTVDEVPATD